ncbi:MAG: energy-coupling factor transporter ATPase [Chloroflexi bacterium 13_1_40CM_4_68_4]|nr:MAG: energy-coupling factor transporter ATPase [Chloroflexi bacterium 13_1_40CM_4_68_4]
MTPLISVDAVSVAYAAPGGGKVPALRDITLEVRRGEWLTIIGHNGSGKSTLAKCFNALLIPGRGEVTVDGIPTRDPDNARRIRQVVGMVFQHPDNQIVATVVEEDVAFGPENLGLERDEILLRVEESIAAVDIGELRLRPPHQLSGGQKQRVAIAGVLAMRPQCLVLDEATAMLDPEGRREVLDTVLRLHQGGTTVVSITHFMSEVPLADRVIVLNEGQIALEGTPREIFAHGDRLRELELDVPQVTQVAEALAAHGRRFARLPITVPELVEALV